jgi:Predicted nucleotide-binding protein containing TIR-like domain
LIVALKSFDFALFVLTPDDLTQIRGSQLHTARDNVIFELGLFIGRLGVDRTFFIVPRGQEDLHLPSDLVRITPATFDPARPDKKYQAALGPACNEVRKAMEACLSAESSSTSTEPERAPRIPWYDPNLSDEDCLAILVNWLRITLVPFLVRKKRHSDIDEELGLPPGTSARLAAKAVEMSGQPLRVAVNTADSILLQRK